MNRGMIVFTAVALLVFPAMAQRNFDDVELKAQRVGANVYMLQGAGGNIGVAIGPNGVLLIDDQFAPLAPKIEEALAGLTDKKLEWVLNTHWHGDHTGGNEYFGKRAPLIAHHNVRKRLAIGSEARDTPPAPYAALPIVTFGDDLQIWLGENQPVQAFHVPRAHTDGDSVIFFPASNVLHTGDIFFSGLFPFIDLDSGGSVQGLIDGVYSIIARIPPDTTIVPGHGPVSTVQDFKRYGDMLSATWTIVKRGVEEGKTLEQLKQEHVLAEYEDLSWGFISTERYLETLYRDAMD